MTAAGKFIVFEGGEGTRFVGVGGGECAGKPAAAAAAGSVAVSSDSSPTSSPANAERLAHRLVKRVEATEFDPAGRITISVGLARGPEHAMNPRELAMCAEAGMMGDVYEATITARPRFWGRSDRGAGQDLIS